MDWAGIGWCTLSCFCGLGATGGGAAGYHNGDAMKEDVMAERDFSDGGFLEPFFLLAAVLWIGVALLFVSLSALGHSRIGGAAPAANQTPVAAPAETQ